MKRKLLIKLNDIIVDIAFQKRKAAKKSVEFFLGRHISENFEDINENYIKFINKYLNNEGAFLQEKAIRKKFNEFYIGREFEGFISDAEFILSKAKVQKINRTGHIHFLSVMSEEETLYLAKSLKLANIITSENVQAGLKDFKLKTNNFHFVGNSLSDYKAACAEEVPFIGIGIKDDEISEQINELDDIIH